MDKVFALHNGKVYFQKDGIWHLCIIAPESVMITDNTASIPIGERYTLTEIKARVGVSPLETEPEMETEPNADTDTEQNFTPKIEPTPEQILESEMVVPVVKPTKSKTAKSE